MNTLRYEKWVKPHSTVLVPVTFGVPVGAEERLLESTVIQQLADSWDENPSGFEVDEKLAVLMGRWPLPATVRRR